MRVTYLAHSGFMVEDKDAIMVFDYFRDPSHIVVKTLEKNPELPVIFFVTNHHKDHYNDVIFNLGQNHKRCYILSNDVEARDTNSRLAIQGMSAGDEVDNILGGISVKAFHSTGLGVSFVVTTKSGIRIFHGGDLNLWQWDEPDNVRSEQKLTADFKKIINRIAQLYPTLDIAFMPVDVRQGKDCAEGAADFLDTIEVKDFFPMHFDGDHTVACDFAAYPVQKKVATQYHCLYEPGESINLTEVADASEHQGNRGHHIKK